MRETVRMQTWPDRLLVLLVLFTVDNFYSIFSGPRTPWETADKWKTMYNVKAYRCLVKLLVFIRSYSQLSYSHICSLHLCIYGMFRTFCGKHSCQWYAQNHHSLVLGTWVTKKTKKPRKKQVIRFTDTKLQFHIDMPALNQYKSVGWRQM